MIGVVNLQRLMGESKAAAIEADERSQTGQYL